MEKEGQKGYKKDILLYSIENSAWMNQFKEWRNASIFRMDQVRGDSWGDMLEIDSGIFSWITFWRVLNKALSPLVYR